MGGMSDILGIANIGASLAPLGIGLIDRQRLQQDPFILAAIQNYAQQANAIGGQNVFGPQMSGLQQMMGMNPTNDLLQNYAGLLGSQGPQLTDSTQGLAGLLGRGGMQGFSPNPGPSFQAGFGSQQLGPTGTPSLSLPQSQFPTNPAVGGPNIMDWFSHAGGNQVGYGGGGYDGSGFTGTAGQGHGGQMGWPTTKVPVIGQGGNQPKSTGTMGGTPPPQQQNIGTPWTSQGAQQPMGQPPATQPPQQRFNAQVGGNPAQGGGAQAPVSQSLLQQVFANPVSLTPQIQTDMYRRGATQYDLQNQNALRQMRNEAGAAGTLGGGALNQNMLQANEQNIMNRGNLQRDIGIEAARTNFGDLLNSANLQLGAENALAQQQLAQNAQNLGAYQNNFQNQARIFQDAYSAQGQDQQRQLQLLSQMTGLPLAQMGLSNDAIQRLIQARMGQLSPSSLGGGTQVIPAGGGGGGGGSGGGDRSQMLGALAGYGLGGGFGSF